MTKKRRKTKKVPMEIYEEMLKCNFMPFRLCTDAQPWFVKSIPPERLNSVYISGSYEPAQTNDYSTITPGGTLIGGMDVYRNAPDDPVNYNKDWYAILIDPNDKTILLFEGPITKKDEHWINELPERLKNAEMYYAPSISNLGETMLSEGNDLLKYQIKFWRESLKPTINQALELVPEDKLNWAPADKMIPLGKLFIHISEASGWWYDDVMKGKPLVGHAYADKPSPSKETIAKYLETHWQRLERLFTDSPDVLGKTYKIERRGRTVELDGYWIFTHLLEHDIHHRSQINQYLRILGIEPPKI